MKQILVFAMVMSGAAFAADAAKAAFVLNGDAAKGEAKFKQLCASCHGEKGDGNGAAAAALNPKPANFADAKRWAEIDDQYAYEMVKEGGAAKGRSPLMVSWKAAMSDQELRDVVAYVRNFGKPAAPAAPAKDAKPAAKPAKKK